MCTLPLPPVLQEPSSWIWLTKPDMLKEAWKEFNERTGGGVGGTKRVSLFLSKDFAPLIDLRWPEYVTTIHEEEWILSSKGAEEFNAL